MTKYNGRFCCVKCDSTEDLEFIEVSKNKVQLLCITCRKGVN